MQAVLHIGLLAIFLIIKCCFKSKSSLGVGADCEAVGADCEAVIASPKPLPTANKFLQIHLTKATTKELGWQMARCHPNFDHSITCGTISAQSSRYDSGLYVATLPLCGERNKKAKLS